MPIVKIARLLALAAGSLDLLTGFCFVFYPQGILPLMHLETPAGEALVYLRFMGAFVLAVGACYLLALVCGGLERLRAMLELTILLRLSTGVFSTAALGLGSLSIGWVGVPIAGFTLIGIQLWLLGKLRPDKIEPLSPRCR
ncbi:MAG: hypothetical protein IPP19_07380 [Verrucomicrobia bacterium]|nr:hypothetical protein [Verrucomicrobiota bacterium]